MVWQSLILRIINSLLVIIMKNIRIDITIDTVVHT